MATDPKALLPSERGMVRSADQGSDCDLPTMKPLASDSNVESFCELSQAKTNTMQSVTKVSLREFLFANSSDVTRNVDIIAADNTEAAVSDVFTQSRPTSNEKVERCHW